MSEPDVISVRGAKEHNLQDVSLDIPKKKLVVFTGVSGSGKSSLAFDTLYAEGQRRYVESLSAYARQFLGQMEKPKYETIRGLSPTISIEQKAASNNPLLKTLVAAVSGKLNPDVNLVSTLNGSEFTVFAPVDSAFAKLDAATVDSLKDPANAATLTSILTYHVVPGQIAPDAIDGTQTTVNGATVTVTGSGDNIKVNDANVICGGVHTANATVYLIDSVLMPPAKN